MGNLDQSEHEYSIVTSEILLIVNRYRVAASNATRPSFSQKKTMLISCFFSPNNLKEIAKHKFVFTKTIRLLALNFYEAIVNYHLVEISSW